MKSARVCASSSSEFARIRTRASPLSMLLHLQNRFEFGDRLWKWKRKETDVNDNDNEEVKTNPEKKKKEKTHLGQAIDGIGQHVRQVLVVLGGGVVVHFSARVLVVFFRFCVSSKTYTLNM